MTACNLENCPQEIIAKIFGHMSSPEDVVSFALSNRTVYNTYAWTPKQHQPQQKQPAEMHEIIHAHDYNEGRRVRTQYRIKFGTYIAHVLAAEDSSPRVRAFVLKCQQRGYSFPHLSARYQGLRDIELWLVRLRDDVGIDMRCDVYYARLGRTAGLR